MPELKTHIQTYVNRLLGIGTGKTHVIQTIQRFAVAWGMHAQRSQGRRSHR
jgi:uncharacterized membrane protein YjjP (DUF1212 family)